MSTIRIKKLNDTAIMPTYGTEESAGADLYACLESDIEILPGCSAFIPTGLAMELPKGYAGLLFARSGMACKRDLAPANKVGVIDSDYRGEFIVVLHNHGMRPQVVKHGERIAQLLVMPVLAPSFEVVDDLSSTERDIGGFGSTGK